MYWKDSLSKCQYKELKIKTCLVLPIQWLYIFSSCTFLLSPPTLLWKCVALHSHHYDSVTTGPMTTGPVLLGSDYWAHGLFGPRQLGPWTTGPVTIGPEDNWARDYWARDSWAHRQPGSRTTGLIIFPSNFPSYFHTVQQGLKRQHFLLFFFVKQIQ